MTGNQTRSGVYDSPKEEIYQKRILANSYKSIVVALSSDTVGKMYHSNSLDRLKHEEKLMRYANEVNDLVVGCKGVIQDVFGNHMLTMERIYPIESRAFDSITIETFIVETERKLRELHARGFAYRDLFTTRVVEPDGYPRYANFLLTTNGIRLVDTEMSKLFTEMPATEFWNAMRSDLMQLNEVKGKLLHFWRPNYRTNTNTEEV